jgi:MFS family permease
MRDEVAREVVAVEKTLPAGRWSWPPALRALRHRNFRLFFVGQFVSRIGFWMQQVALSWLVYRLSQSPFLLGLIGFAAQFPTLVLGLFAGVVADRFNRHRVVVFTQVLAMVQALILAFLTLGGWITVGEIFLLTVFYGAGQAFEMPARQSFLMEIVGQEDLVNAIALNSSLVNGARVIGPAVAGVLVVSLGEGSCFLINGFSYLAIIIGFLAMRLTPRPDPPPAASTTTYIRQGLSYTFRTPPVRTLIFLIGLVSFLGTFYTILMPVFAEEVLHSGARGYGLLMGASGTGAVIGTLFLARHRGTHKLGGAIAFALARFGVGLILFALSRDLWLSLLLLPMVGSGFMVPMAAANTLLQTLAPDHMRGRVMSLFFMMVMGTAPLGSLLAGALAPHLGVQVTVGLSGLVCLGGVLWFIPHLAQVRDAVSAPGSISYGA